MPNTWILANKDHVLNMLIVTNYEKRQLETSHQFDKKEYNYYIKIKAGGQERRKEDKTAKYNEA